MDAAWFGVLAGGLVAGNAAVVYMKSHSTEADSFQSGCLEAGRITVMGCQHQHFLARKVTVCSMHKTRYHGKSNGRVARGYFKEGQDTTHFRVVF